MEDVLVGFLLGLIMAYCFYRTTYVALMSHSAGSLSCLAQQPASGSRRVGANGGRRPSNGEPNNSNMYGEERV